MYSRCVVGGVGVEVALGGCIGGGNAWGTGLVVLIVVMVVVVVFLMFLLVVGVVVGVGWWCWGG